MTKNKLEKVISQEDKCFFSDIKAVFVQGSSHNIRKIDRDKAVYF